MVKLVMRKGKSWRKGSGEGSDEGITIYPPVTIALIISAIHPERRFALSAFCLRLLPSNLV